MYNGKGLFEPLFFFLVNPYIKCMISDSTKLFFLDVDHVIIVFFTMFFLAEPAMLWILPVAYWFIPVASFVLKFGLIWLIPGKAGRFVHFITLMFTALSGYAILTYVTPSTLWYSAFMTISMSIILILQFSGITPDAEERIRTRIDQQIILWTECGIIEKEKKDG